MGSQSETLKVTLHYWLEWLCRFIVQAIGWLCSGTGWGTLELPIGAEHKPINVLKLNKYCDKSFINKPAFLNFVPQQIRRIYCAGKTWFHRSACVIITQAHVSLMTRLSYDKNNFLNNEKVSKVATTCFYSKEDGLY